MGQITSWVLCRSIPTIRVSGNLRSAPAKKNIFKVRMLSVRIFLQHCGDFCCLLYSRH